MARVLRVALLLGSPAGALAARVQERAAQALPWKKGALFGALLGQTLSSNTADASKERPLEVASGMTSAESSSAAVDRLQGLLAQFLADPNSLGSAAAGKVVNNLRRLDSDLLEGLEKSIGRALVQSTSPFISGPPLYVEDHSVPFGDGGQYVQIGHYRAQERDAEQVAGLRLVLWSTERADALENVFLHSLALSHTHAEVEADPGAEVVMVTEPHNGVLRDQLMRIDLDFHQSMRLVSEAFYAVLYMLVKEIPHYNFICADAIFLKGDPATPESLHLALSPVLLIPESPSTPSELFVQDTAHLGALLRFMFNRNWPRELRAKADLLMAFGRALESGAIVADAGAEWEQLVNSLVSDSLSPDELVVNRIDYLRRAVAAEKDPGNELQNVEVAAA